MTEELIVSSEGLSAYLQSRASNQEISVCAIDTEADSLHRYKESLCLIQFAVGDECVLIDPLAIENLSALGEYLRRSEVWMHGADYDMTMLKRRFGDLPGKVYDTQIGARLLGVRKFGLGDLVLRYFGIELSKSSQKADWGKRPLSEKMVEYALNDVRYLLEMGGMIVKELEEKGRLGWFEESCDAARLKVLERDESKEDVWRIQGSGKLERHGLAYLRALWHWRDVEAKTWDRPSFMVAPNRQLLEWSSDLSSRKQVALPPHFRSERIKRFKEALASVEQLSHGDFPEKPQGKRRRKDKNFDRKLDQLLKIREAEALRYDIEGALIAPRSVLEALAANEVEPGEVLLKWQLECMKLA